MTKNKRLIGFMVLFVLLACIPIFFKSPYYLGLLIIAIVYTMLAMTFVLMLRTGMVSLCVAAFWGIGAYTSATLVTKAGLSFWLSLPASTAVAMLLALVIGFFIVKNAGFSFVIITAVLGMLFPVTIGNLPYFGGYSGLSEIPRPDPINLPLLPSLEFTSKVPYFYLVLVIFAIVVLVVQACYSSWAGRAWKAIGFDPALAESIGINLFVFRITAFVLSSGICGLVGAFYAHYARFIFPDTFSMFTTIYTQVYSILGGIGYAIMGPFVGSMIMTFFTEFTRSTGEFAPMFPGIVLVLLIAFLPTGLLSLLDKTSRLESGISSIRKIIVNNMPKREKAL